MSNINIYKGYGIRELDEDSYAVLSGYADDIGSFCVQGEEWYGDSVEECMSWIDSISTEEDLYDNSEEEAQEDFDAYCNEISRSNEDIINEDPTWLSFSFDPWRF